MAGETVVAAQQLAVEPDVRGYEGTIEPEKGALGPAGVGELGAIPHRGRLRPAAHRHGVDLGPLPRGPGGPVVALLLPLPQVEDLASPAIEALAIEALGQRQKEAVRTHGQSVSMSCRATSTKPGLRHRPPPHRPSDRPRPPPPPPP